MTAAILATLLIAASCSFAATYYIRPDGGSASQCTGLADQPYPGAGTNQPCAWSHPFWALDGNEPPSWIIQGGETMVIASGSYRMGLGAPNAGWCSEGYPWDCQLPPLPSGPDADHPTRILGSGWNEGCPDAPEWWGTERAWRILSLEGTDNAQIRCLEITDHSSCVESHSNAEAACERQNYPFGDWAGYGITASDSENVLLSDLDIHGLAHGGIHAGRLTDWTVENVRIAGNGWVGWDGDIGGDSANSGTLRFTNWVVEWNGCAETYPDEAPDHCWDQSHGGYGDGVGTEATGGHWIIEDSVFRYNTSDGLDLLYLGSDTVETMAEVRRTMSYGNAGNPVKLAGPSLVENCLIVSNCAFFDDKSYAQDFSDNCRAGGNALAIDFHQGSSAVVVNSTIAGQGDVLLEIECREGSSCNGTETMTVINTAFRGYGQFGTAGEDVALFWDAIGVLPANMDYNIMDNLRSDCPYGANDICSDPMFAVADIDSFDGHLLPASPAIDSGLGTGNLIPATDLEGNSRPLQNGTDRGAYEFDPLSLLKNTIISLKILAGMESILYNGFDVNADGLTGLREAIYNLQTVSQNR